MPIIMSQLDDNFDQYKAAASKAFSPKFFDKKLTGKGGNAPGLLSIRNNPPAVPKDRRTSYTYYDYQKNSTTQNGSTTVSKIPVTPYHPNIMAHMQNLVDPNVVYLPKIATIPGGSYTPQIDVHADLQVVSFTLDETVQTNSYTGMVKKTTVLTPAYLLRLYFRNTATPRDTYKLAQSLSYNMNVDNIVVEIRTANPVEDWNSTISIDLMNSHRSITVDTKAFMDYMMNYEVYDSACKRSEEWQEHIDEIFREILDNLKNVPSFKDLIHQQVRYMMAYNIPLDKYRTIYNDLCKYMPNPQDVTDICKQNLNLLLSNTLHSLDANKPNLQKFQPKTGVTMPPSVQRLSKEQTAAVKSTEPLILVQAGAGTGKSTLILGRIDYLTACGVDPQDITVLSFTNAAADNITAKNPDVHSMTIARMIHEIYTANFQNHELSQLETLLNSLEIYYPNAFRTTSVVSEFYSRIKQLTKNAPTAFTDMNNFIEAHYDEVINILNTIRQTSLELEIIICYQKIDTFIEPSTIKSRYLIIDEVQDNSIFEFVYTLKYINKHQEAMFIVGDCSQTLYEFRSSNPRALNILEGSGIFATYQLTTNYRSNQEILDMANVLLNNIEANQYANIQLHANSRVKVTEQSFLEKVRFSYQQLNRISDFHQALPSIFAREVKSYIDQCLAKGEQIAFLAFTRRDIARIKEILITMYPNINPDTDICSLVPDKMYNETLFSKFICKYWTQMQFAPSASIMNIIAQKIMAQLPFLVYNDAKAANRVHRMLNDWHSKESYKVQEWFIQYQAGTMSQDDFLKNVKENMLDYEIRTNAVKQSLLSQRNQMQKQASNVATAKFLLSTIHSAKGLEFDNVVVLYRNESGIDEEKKRMYYVAFTRAMKSEFILAYDTMVSPQIQADYLTVLQTLHMTHPAPNSPLNKPTKPQITI